MVKLRNEKHRILHRLKIVRGNLNRIIEMVESDVYCMDVLHQSLAVQNALKKVDIVIMQDHLKTCAVDQIKNGEEAKTIKELAEIYRYK